MALPGALLPWIECRFFDGDGVPLAAGKVYAYEAGTDTPKDTYDDSELTTPNANPVVLDADGRAQIFIGPGGYKFVVTDSADVEQYTYDNVEDVGLSYLAYLGNEMATGSSGVTSGYTVLATDLLVEVSSTGGPNPCIVNLPSVASRGTQVVIKNSGTVALEVRPDGADTIDGQSTFSVAAASSPTFPSILLYPDGVSNWIVAASH